jgi:phospholipid/cholesterol/gamma-HCH transport system substrate-binding protein
MKITAIETIVGAIVIFIAVSFFYFAYTIPSVKSIKGYNISATFNKVSGLVNGAEVRLSGIKIGSVSSQKLNLETYDAIVLMEISEDIRIPEDSSAKITSQGLLGTNYIEIEPGGSYTMLTDGEAIELTQGSVDLMDLLGKAVFGAAK